MPIDDIKNFIAVSDRLGTAGQPSEAQLRDVADAGFEVVVNLGLLDPRYCLADEAGSVASLGLAYHHIPVDFNAPQPDDLRRFFDAMDAPGSGRRTHPADLGAERHLDALHRRARRRLAAER